MLLPPNLLAEESSKPRRTARQHADLLVFAIGLCWIGYGAMGLLVRPAVLIAVLAVSACAVGVLAKAGGRRAAPWIRATEPLPGSRYRWAGFVLAIIGEIALLNLALVLLQAFDAERFLIPAISAVVGLHFVPLAWLFGRRDLYWLAVAMLAGSAATVVAVMQAPEFASIPPRIEGIANGAMLVLVRVRTRRA